METGPSQPQPSLSPFSRAAGWDPPALMPPTSSGCGPSTPSLYLLPPWPTPGAPRPGVPLPMHLCPFLSPTIVTALSCPNRCGLCKIIIRPGNFPQGFPLALLAEAPQNPPTVLISHSTNDSSVLFCFVLIITMLFLLPTAPAPKPLHLGL